MWIERTDQSLIGRWWWTVDRMTLGAILLLVGMGLYVIASASLPEAVRNGFEPFYYFKRHLGFVSAGLIGMFFLSIMPQQRLVTLAWSGFAISAALVGLTLVSGVTHNGASRWLSIAGFSLQPSELLKPFFIVISGYVLAKRFAEPTKPLLQISLCLLALVAGMLILQPDVSQALMMVIVWLGQLLLAGYSIWIFVALGSLAVCGLVGAYHYFPHVAARVDGYLEPNFDPYSQVGFSIRAFMNGGIFGRGANEGRLKDSLADSYADFVFAAVGEEFGFFLSAIIIMLFCLIVLRGMARMLHEETGFAFLATSGLLLLFGLQALMNFMVTLGMIPTTGVTLPFVSYGGSAMLGMAITMGFVLAFTRRVQFTKGMRVLRNRSIR